MKNNASGSAEKTPMGQCPLCYTENAYSISRCSECNLPLPWAKAEIQEREPCGACLKCQAENPYTTLNCGSCGSRLPWANAVSAVMQQKAATGQIAMLAAPSKNGHSMPASMIHGSAAPIYNSAIHDGPNQIVDAISFICPPLGFISYVTLLSTVPRQALNAARFALFGMVTWIFILMVFIGPVKFGRRSLPSAPPPSGPVVPGEEVEIYQ